MTNPMLYGAASPMTKEERERQEKLASSAGSGLEFPSPTPEEKEAAARAMCDLGVPADVSIWDQGAPHKKIYYRQLAEAALTAAMAVRRGK